MGRTKIDRTLAVVLREGAVTEEQSERFVVGRPGLMGAALLAASLVAWQWIGPWAAFGLGMGLTMMRSSFLHSPPKPKAITRKARVEISEEGIKAAGDRFIPRAEIAQAYFQPRGEERPTLRCLDRRSAVVFEAEVDDEAEAQELLEAMGQDASQVRATFRAAGPVLESNGGWAVTVIGSAALFLLALWAGLRGGWPFGGPMLAVALTLTAAVAATRRVEVGVDGILVTWLSRKRFIPFEELVSVTPVLRAVELRLRDGSLVRLAVPSAKQPQHLAALDVAALAARIDEASRAHARSAPSSERVLGSAGARELALAVARGERAVAEWRAELERMHDPETHGGYRTQGARGEDLWRVVEDTTAPEDARAGAAMALRKEDGAPPRLRIAAEAVASPKLRIALERAADPESDEAALDEALEAFSEKA